MIRVRARSGHILTVSDDEAAARWVGFGYERVEEKPAPAKRTTKKADAKSADDK